MAAAAATMPATAVAAVDQAGLAPVIALHPVRSEITTDQTDPVARIAALQARIAELEDRNRELASDLDDALDQLAGHALHDHQERLVRTPVNAFAAIEWEGHDR